MENKQKIKKYKTLMWISGFPFVLLFGFALITSLTQENSLFGQPIAPQDVFLLMIIIFIRSFWYIFVLCIIGFIYSLISILKLRKERLKD